MASIGAGYLVTRRAWAGILIGGLLFVLIGSQGAGAGVVVGTISGVIYATGVLVSFFRFGLVSVLVYLWLASFSAMLLTDDLTAWHAPYTVFAVIVVLLVLAYGA